MPKQDANIQYKRILLKCSGEALMGKESFGIDKAVLDKTAKDIAELVFMGVQVGVVIGGGNFCRGKSLAEAGVGRVTADHMGMLATLMNALALRDALDSVSLPVLVMSAIPVAGIVAPFDRRKALLALQRGEVLLFATGTGNPFFTTDSAACLRAIEIEADIVLKATKVDGIYSEDPKTHAHAKRYDFLTYKEVLQEGLEVMDATAICLCQEHNMPLQVFDMAAPNALRNIVLGEHVGTKVGKDHDQ
jgi:uridylate kinase